MIKVGILGLGFMGKMHYEAYQRIRGATVTAICDVDAKKRAGDWSAIGGNIDSGAGCVDLSGIETYGKLDAMLKNADIDVVDITLPTYLHSEYAIQALKAGKHVICEKPMARTSAEARKMIAAAEKAKKKLFIAQCIRYWPQYDKAREIIRSEKYGSVLSATFTRLSLTPTWSWENWLMDRKKSGNCALDLHIHDADFIRHCFGDPKAVVSSGSGFKKDQLDHITTLYEYDDNRTITAEGGWDLPAGYGFTMAFNIVMEKATLQCSTPDLDLKLHPLKGKSRVLKVAAGDGYLNELKDFIPAVAKDRPAKQVTPQSALSSVRLIEAEEKSALTGRPVKF